MIASILLGIVIGNAAYHALRAFRSTNYCSGGADGYWEAYCEMHNAEIDRLTFEYKQAIPIPGTVASVPRNKVILDMPNPDAPFGAIALERNKKIFKDLSGRVYRIEMFEPMACRIVSA